MEKRSDPRHPPKDSGNAEIRRRRIRGEVMKLYCSPQSFSEIRKLAQDAEITGDRSKLISYLELYDCYGKQPNREFSIRLALLGVETELVVEFP